MEPDRRFGEAVHPSVKLNNPVALIVVVVLSVALNGFLFYSYRQQPSLPSVGATQPAAETYPAADESSADPSPPEQEAAAEAEEAAAPEEGATDRGGGQPRRSR